MSCLNNLFESGVDWPGQIYFARAFLCTLTDFKCLLASSQDELMFEADGTRYMAVLGDRALRSQAQHICAAEYSGELVFVTETNTINIR